MPITEDQSEELDTEFSVRYYEDDLNGWATINYIN